MLGARYPVAQGVSRIQMDDSRSTTVAFSRPGLVQATFRATLIIQAKITPCIDFIPPAHNCGHVPNCWRRGDPWVARLGRPRSAGQYILLTLTARSPHQGDPRVAPTRTASDL